MMEIRLRTNPFARSRRHSLVAKEANIHRHGTFVSVLLTWAVLVVFSPKSHAADLTIPFLNGLRERGYLDVALEYIEACWQRNDLPQSTRELLFFQKGILLQAGVPLLASPQAQLDQLQAAGDCLTRFLDRNPQHELSTQARLLRGEIELELIQRRIWLSDQDHRTLAQQEFWSGVRRGLQEARPILARASDELQTAWALYPVFIPEDQPEFRAQRDRVQELLIRSQLNLAQCDYWEAQTYGVGSEERFDLLTTAAGAYESIQHRYRSQVGGLYARLWQGKCYEDLHSAQGTRLALGIFGELLGHDGQSSSLIKLKDQALRFRLECLNGDHRRDYQLVEQEAEEWLELAGTRAETSLGLGIKWELCRALEYLSRDWNWPLDTRRDYLMRAQEYALQLQVTPSEYTYVAGVMLRRIAQRLGQSFSPDALPPRPPAVPLPESLAPAANGA